MKRVLWLLALLGMGYSHALTIALWNAHNYLIDGRWEYSKFQPYYPKPEHSKAALRAQIKQLSPDVLVLLEIGSDAFLRELQEDLRCEGCVYAHRVCSVGKDPRQIGLLSRVPIEKSVSLILKDPQSETTTKRPILEVTLRGYAFTLIAVHLKGRRPPSKKHPGDLFKERREAEARAVAAWVQESLQYTAQILTLGDFNDGPNSKPIAALESAGLKWIQAIDPSGQAATYHNARTGYSGVFDGFMASNGFLKQYPQTRTSIPNASWSEASDHRVVMLEL